MNIELRGGNLHLARGQTLKVRDGAGSTVCCRSGTLWVTEENRPRDVLLSPGGLPPSVAARRRAGAGARRSRPRDRLIRPQ